MRRRTFHAEMTAAVWNYGEITFSSISTFAAVLETRNSVHFFFGPNYVLCEVAGKVDKSLFLQLFSSPRSKIVRHFTASFINFTTPSWDPAYNTQFLLSIAFIEQHNNFTFQALFFFHFFAPKKTANIHKFCVFPFNFLSTFHNSNSLIVMFALRLSV